MKRRAAQDSDNDDFYEECDLAKIGSPSQSCYRSDRKRRRGVIEKRRRDRINSSLTELRRLVPAAFEKENSAKLEKAEILQMTVDHLKSLHAKGVSGCSLDTAVLAMDYRTVGFRECAAEVARYLISVEGLDIQDPMKLRLMNHLQCYSAQRDAAARSSLQNGAWSHHHHRHQLATSTASNQPIQYGGATNTGMVQHRPTTHVDQLAAVAAAAAANTYVDSGRGSHAPLVDGNPNHGVGIPSGMRLQPTVVAASSGVSSASSVQMAATVSGQFLGVSPVAMLSSPNGFQYVPSSHHNAKPYRPWGFDMVY